MEFSEAEIAAMKFWKERVYDKAKEVDPNNERDWFCMANGFFLACGLDPERAYELAIKAPR